MRTGILIGIAFTLLCVAAVPYGSNLANIYVRLLDGRDTIYNGVGIPPKEWSDQYGGLSERTLIIGNLQVIPGILREIETLKSRMKKLEASGLEQRILPQTKPTEGTPSSLDETETAKGQLPEADPNEVKK